MGSPFEPFANATIVFQVATGATTTDDYGNVVEGRKSLKVKAMVKLLNMNPLYSKKPIAPMVEGLAPDAVYIQGYCTSPATLPKTVRGGMWGQMDWSGTSGDFYLEGPVNSPFGRGTGIGGLVENVTGTKINGWFQIRAGKV